MTDKEKPRQFEKDLAICRKTVEKLSKEVSTLKQEIFVLKAESQKNNSNPFIL